MLKGERHSIILNQLETEGVVRVSELAAQFDVDPVTIRRDLAGLETQGRLRRVHGGAVLRDHRPAASKASELERRIAEAAVRFIPDESVLFMGPGPLVREIVPFLNAHSHLTIITNALDVAWSVAWQQQHTLHVIGGQVSETYAIYGDPEALQRVRVAWVILQTDGLDAERGLTHDDRNFATIARALFDLSTQTMVLLMPDRVGHAGALFIAPPSEVDILITGREAPNPPLWDLSELGVRIVLT